MGSGCANTVSNKNNCGQLFSTDCTIYQGDSIPLLGICCGDTVTEVEKAIIDKLLTVLDGTGIVLSGVTLDNAPFLKNLLGIKDKTLLNMIQLLVDSDTNFRSLIASIQSQLTPTGDNYQFDLGCLASDCCQDATVTRDEIIQMLINKYCDIQDLLTEITEAGNNINTTVVSTIGNYILNNINTCSNQGLTKTGSGATAKLVIKNLVPYKSAIPYWGPLTYFDTSGRGMDGTPVCGWHLMNGQDGYPDWRGYTFAMTTLGVGSNPVDARVNATALNLPLLNAGYGDKKGELAHTLTTSEIPSHSHTITDPGHKHSTQGRAGISDNANDRGVMETNGNQNTTVSTTGISINATGGGQPHANVQPTVYGVWIAPIE